MELRIDTETLQHLPYVYEKTHLPIVHLACQDQCNKSSELANLRSFEPVINAPVRRSACLTSSAAARVFTVMIASARHVINISEHRTGYRRDGSIESTICYDRCKSGSSHFVGGAANRRRDRHARGEIKHERKASTDPSMLGVTGGLGGGATRMM
ncbi:hypothetical protein CERZMDRAFT_82844 [Cercospora zeae-maydis SCOH1-5]|uniref:Uncharacterized protein n=1 Tax=Cercospora zeae-maydis SCOH1-5 TaxID=717836 RepID=A0A6A6FNM6_9PEZI|nr:hypothetical protein CERZMDRAFT_82844 [Cercospora zeae-maydis SCOH1-5]